MSYLPSPSTHGTTLSRLVLLADFFPGANAVMGAACPARVDQVLGSPVVTALHLTYDRGVYSLVRNARAPAHASTILCW